MGQHCLKPHVLRLSYMTQQVLRDYTCIHAQKHGCAAYASCQLRVLAVLARTKNQIWQALALSCSAASLCFGSAPKHCLAYSLPCQKAYESGSASFSCSDCCDLAGSGPQPRRGLFSFRSALKHCPNTLPRHNKRVKSGMQP